MTPQGVVKLGWSWENRFVVTFTSPAHLQALSHEGRVSRLRGPLERAHEPARLLSHLLRRPGGLIHHDSS